MSPTFDSYDVVIVGGAIYGSGLAWWLTQQSDFQGRVLVVERDPTYSFASTSHTNSCIRQQFSNPINIRISQFGANFIRNFRSFMGGDPEVPDLTLQSFGYLYLANTPEAVAALKEVQAIQRAEGAGTKHLSRDQIAEAYPFYHLEDILAGNHNPIDEGYFDGGTMFDWFKRMARRKGAEYLTDTVTGLELNAAGTAVERVELASGQRVACGTLVNASGPRAFETSRMAGIEVPIRPRKRYTFVFDAATPLEQDLPLTIDPSGVHVRSDGRYYLAGCPPDEDPDVATDDFQFDHSLWENKVWPTIANRVPAFESVKVVNSWVGHYAYNSFDQNAVVGPHPEVKNFIFLNGFSGHGLQQSPAITRGVAELICRGRYESLDLSDFAFERLLTGKKFAEKAII